jgi:hypothetical protein
MNDDVRARAWLHSNPSPCWTTWAMDSVLFVIESYDGLSPMAR